MSNLYAPTKGLAAIVDFDRTMKIVSRVGDLAPLRGIFPGVIAPIARRAEQGPTVKRARCLPITNTGEPK